MIKSIFIAVVLVIVFNAIFVFSGGLELLVKTEQKTVEEQAVSTGVIDVFRFTLEDEVVKKIRQPIEGFRPDMYMRVFPGLVETDFDGVQASLGIYEMKDGELQFVLDQTQLVHSAAEAIAREGYQTMLKNISKRIGIDLNTDGTITDVMNSLTRT